MLFVGENIMYDTIVILSQDRESASSLGWELKDRVDFGVRDYESGLARCLTMTGNHGKHDEGFPGTHAEAMRNYAMGKCVPGEQILLEEQALDTVGQAIFTKRKIIMPNEMNNVLVVSSDYHLTRVAAIFDFVFGKRIRVVYGSVHTSMIKDKKITDAQNLSLEAFFCTFEGVERGNQEAIEERLFSKHRLYMQS